MESWWCEACAKVCFLDCHGRCSDCSSDLVISCAALYVSLYAPMQSAALRHAQSVSVKPAQIPE
jgi:hypothetical protein